MKSINHILDKTDYYFDTDNYGCLPYAFRLDMACVKTELLEQSPGIFTFQPHVNFKNIIVDKLLASLSESDVIMFFGKLIRKDKLQFASLALLTEEENFEK